MTLPKTMKAVIKPKAQPGFEISERPIPEIGSTDVLVQVRAASICGTDLHIYNWDEWAQGQMTPPVIVGHEVCGTVVARGEMVQSPQVGDFVSLESHVIDNTCRYCRTGNGHICENTELIGLQRDGGFAEYIAIPAQNAWVNPPDMSLEIAVLQENFGNAVHTAFAVDLRAKKILVTGCGPVGLMTIAVAKATGARAVYATDVSEYRVEFARKMGADLAINALEQDVLEEVRKATGGEGVDTLLEMSGAPSAIQQGFELLKPGGEVAMLGVVGKPVEFDLDNSLIFKGATVYGITGRRLWQTWYQSRGLVNSGAVDLSPMVTHKYPLEDIEKAIEAMRSGKSGKVMLTP